jgi:LysR family transcriptional regulator, glycine cleavage system transcriptional activator
MTQGPVRGSHQRAAFAGAAVPDPDAACSGSGRSPLRIELVIEHRLADLDGDRIDFAIRYGPGPWPGLTTWLLLAETLVPVASPSLAAQVRPDADPASLLKHPLLHDSDVTAWRAWLGRHGVGFRARVVDRRFEDYGMVLAAAEAGLGVALMRQPLGMDRLRAGTLTALNAGGVGNPKKQFIVPPNASRSAGAAICMARIEMRLPPVS